MYNVCDSGRQKACENEQLFPIRTCYKWQLCVWMYLYQEVLLPIKWTICRTRFLGPWGRVSFLIKCWEIKTVCGNGPVINICTSRTSQNWLYASLPCQSLGWEDTSADGCWADEHVKTSMPTVHCKFPLKKAGAHARLVSRAVVSAEFPDIPTSQSLAKAVHINVINLRLKLLFLWVYCRMKNIAASVTFKTSHPRCHLICQNSSQKCFILA